MGERLRLSPRDATLLAAAALVGTLPPALFGAVCLARFLPLEEGARSVLGLTLSIPLWCAAACSAFLARNAARAWVACAVSTLVLGLFAFGVR